MPSPSNVSYHDIYLPPAPNYFFDKLHPDLAVKAREFISLLSSRLGDEYGVIITCTYRPAEHQKKLHRSGRGQPGIIRTNNKAGESPHNATLDCAGERVAASRAFDFVIFWLGKPCAEYGQEYQTAGAVAGELGLLWGGRAAAKHREPGHIELSAGYQ